MNFLEKIEINPQVPIMKGNAYPFIEMANVSTCFRSPDRVEIKRFNSGIKFQDGDTVIARITPCLQNGKRFFCQNIGAGFGSTEFLVFRPKDDSIDNIYLYYFMQTEFIKQSMINSMTGATGRQRVNNDVFKDITVEFPDIRVQRKIGNILSLYDDLIENNQKQIKLIEEAAQRLYKEWFVDFRFPGYENTPIVDGLPEGWKKTVIKRLCKRINAGGTPSRGNKTYWNNPTIRWFKTGELQDCWLLDSDEMISQEGLEGSSAKLFPKNTILMAIYASPTIGRLGILNFDSSCNQAALCLLADERIVSWQWLYCKLYELRGDFNAVAKGAGQQNINAETVKQKEVILPEKNIIDTFSNQIAPLFDKRRILQKQIIALTQGRDFLLPKLMSGEIEV